MAWTYDPTDLNRDTASGRLNVVRLLTGDTDSSDPQMQDEELVFSLTQVSDDVYLAASYVANTIASKYSRLVTTELDGQLQVEYGELANNYRSLSQSLKQQAKSVGATLNLTAGGIDNTTICTVDEDTTRPLPSFRAGQFNNKG